MSALVKHAILTVFVLLYASEGLPAGRDRFLENRKGKVKFPHVSHEFCIGCHEGVKTGPRKYECSKCHVKR
jgi:hypothetical protein